MSGGAVRWRRYGKDRLYVTAADGTKLGYRDLLTGEDVLVDPARAAEFAAIVEVSVPAAAPGLAEPELAAVR